MRSASELGKPFSVVASRGEKPVLVVQNRLKSWSAARLVIGRQAFDRRMAFHFAQWANKLKLTKEVYCLHRCGPGKQRTDGALSQ